MKLWQRIFGSKKNTPKKPEQSKYKTAKKVSKDILFATNFTAKGGKFLFSTSLQNTREFLNDICIENQCNSEQITCMDQNLTNLFHLNFVNDKLSIKNNKSLFINCEYLIGNTGRILVCNKQIKNLLAAMKNQSYI